MEAIVDMKTGTLHGPAFEVDDDLNVVRWPEETAEATGLPAQAALNKKCWQIIHPDHDLKPPMCESFCLAKKSGAKSGEERKFDNAGAAEICASMRLPEPLGGALIWIPSKDKHTPENPREEIIVRGCMSAKIGDLSGTLDFIRRYCAADDCELFVADTASSEVLYSGCEGPDRDAFEELTQIPFGAGYPGGVTARQTPMYTNDFQNERLFLRDSVRQRGIRSFLGIPLAEHGQPVGYLGLGWRDSRIPAQPLIRRLDGIKPLLHAGISKPSSTSLSLGGSSLGIRCFGGFEVSRGGVALPLSLFSRRRALLLLKILLLRAPQPIHRDVLIDHLWPDSDCKNGRNRLHGVVHALRAAIEQGPVSYIRNQQDFYFFDTQSPHFADLFRFRQLLSSAKRASRQKLPFERVTAYLESAVSLYQGDLFADEPYVGWLAGARPLLRQQYIEAVRDLVHLQMQMGQVTETIAILQNALALYPHFEDLHQMLIRSFLAAGRKAEAMEQFEACVRMVRGDCGSEISSDTLALSKML